jgi:hypothetical protein
MEKSYIKIEKLPNGEIKFNTQNLTPIELLGLLTHYKNLIEIDLINNCNTKEKK